MLPLHQPLRVTWNESNCNGSRRQARADVRIGMHLTNDDAQWLAGLLEGEGSFLAGPPSARNVPRVALEMTDRDVVVRAARLLAVGSVHRGDRHPERGWKPAYRIALKGARAVRTMLALRPLLGEARRAQIDAALASYAPKRAGVGRFAAGTATGCCNPSRSRDLCRRHYAQLLKDHGGKAPRVLVADLDPRIIWERTPSARLFYLAGLLEGEGTFSPAPPSSRTWCRLSISMCDRDVVAGARHLMESGSIREIQDRRSLEWRPVFKTELGGERAAALMRKLRPLMGARRRIQIDRALASRASVCYRRLDRAPVSCVVDGCEDRPRGRGLCHKHYMRWLRGEGRWAPREPRRKRSDAPDRYGRIHNPEH